MFYLIHQWQKLISSSKQKGAVKAGAARPLVRVEAGALAGPSGPGSPGFSSPGLQLGPTDLRHHLRVRRQPHAPAWFPLFWKLSRKLGLPGAWAQITSLRGAITEALGVFDRASTHTRWERGTSPRGSQGQSRRTGEWGLGKHWVHSGNSCGTLPWTRCWRRKGQEAPQSPPGRSWETALRGRALETCTGTAAVTGWVGGSPDTGGGAQEEEAATR